MRITPQDEYELDSVEKAKNTIVELTKESTNVNALDLFYSDNLEEIESGIKQLNDYSSKCWILSAITLYTLIYEKNMWQQSGLTWEEYSRQARERIGLDPRDISEQLAGARFFIKYRDKLINNGWSTKVPTFNLARAELAVELCGDVDEAIQHVVHDSFREFRSWYQSFKVLPQETDFEDKRPDIVISKKDIRINGIRAVTISEQLPKDEREKLESYLTQIYTAIKRGDVPAIVPVYDENEARTLLRLRDKNRQGK